MPDAQNERTESRGRRGGKPRRRGKSNQDQVEVRPQHVPEREPEPEPEPVVEQAVVVAATPARFVRPGDIAPPTEKVDIYCMHHMALTPEVEPFNTRPNSEMTTLRHLAVDHFGAATLFCDCIHNGPHEWPPLLQKVESAIELDQFLTASTNEE